MTHRTVQEVVECAPSRYSETLVIGEGARKNVSTRDPQAGPPEKVWRDLTLLHEFAQEMRAGKGFVGDSVVDWFLLRGSKVSGESMRTQEEYSREWPVDGRMVRSDLHMKPNNRAGGRGCASTSSGIRVPARCLWGGSVCTDRFASRRIR